jgi:hypothetical protein
MLIDLADAVKNELNDPDNVWSLAFTAERMNDTTKKLEDLSSLQVTVRPNSAQRTRVTRQHMQTDYGIGIGLRQTVAGGPSAANTGTDGLVALCEELAAHFDGFVTTVGSVTATVTDSETVIVMDDESLRQRNLFVGVVNLSFRAVQ